MNELDKIIKKLQKFVNDRDWDQFHTSKNLAISIVLESSELLENFQWYDENNFSKDEINNIKEEIADVFICILMLSNKLNIDLINETNKKIIINQKKYPIDKFKGKSTKYNKLD